MKITPATLRLLRLTALGLGLGATATPAPAEKPAEDRASQAVQPDAALTKEQEEEIKWLIARAGANSADAKAAKAALGGRLEAALFLIEQFVQTELAYFVGEGLGLARLRQIRNTLATEPARKSQTNRLPLSAERVEVVEKAIRAFRGDAGKLEQAEKTLRAIGEAALPQIEAALAPYLERVRRWESVFRVRNQILEILGIGSCPKCGLG